MKKCSTCGIEKELSLFGIAKHLKSGINPRCKECCRIAIDKAKAKRTTPYSIDTVKKAAREARFHEKHPEMAKYYRDKYYKENKTEILARHLELSKRPDQVAKRKAWYEENKENLISKSKAYQIENREKTNAKNNAWRKANPEKPSAYYQAYKEKHPGKTTEQRRAWKKQNPHSVAAATALRRAKKKNATPRWANLFFIQEAYHLARMRTTLFGFKWEVDHIIPLQSKEVCGLHVENNLRVIPASINRLKGNKVIQYA